MAWIISLSLGAIAVIQGGVNRQIMTHWGLSAAILMNCVIVFTLGVAFWFLVQSQPQILPPEFVSRVVWSESKWWFLIPGICGFLLITGIPFVIPQLGAMKVFLGIVVGQMVFSLIWDLYVEKIPFHFTRALGATLAIVGLLVANWKR